MIPLSRRSFIAATAGALASTQALGQAAYPTRPIRLIVPFSPGGSSDFTGRLIAQKMSETLGQTVVVENKPGANGIIGCDMIAKAAPDGYSLLIVPREIGVNPSITKTLPFDVLKDFTWIGLATEGPFVIVVNPNIPAKTFAELVALAKAQPGKLSYGSIGNGSISHLNVEALK
ncbi:MAG: ABC transporter substrate-binding protein, partial [Rhizobiales bacterium PAR1]